MEFRIKRVFVEGEPTRCYHLYNQQEKLILVADHNTPWLPEDSHHQVRFARADGELVASLDLPWQADEHKRGMTFTRHAIILDHAVYAILTMYWDSEAPDKRPYLVIEVEDHHWFVKCCHPDGHDYAIYEDVPTNLTIVDELLEEELPPVVGFLNAEENGREFDLSLPGNVIQKTAVIALALLFLLDRRQKER